MTCMMPPGRRVVVMWLRGLGVLAAMLLALGCLMPEAEPVPDAATPVSEDLVEAETAAVPAEPVIVRSLPTVSNVRGGPDTEQAVVFQVAAGAELTVRGRNADGTWLQIAFEDQTGWIYGPLTDIAAETLAGLAITAEPVDIVESPAPAESEPAEPAVEAGEDDAAVDAPAPEPAAEPVATPPSEPPAEADMLQVTGDVVNLRRGPGTHHARAGQVSSGDQLRVTGRNADGTWLQVSTPDAPDERLWIYGALTTLDADAARARIAEVEIPLSPTAFAAVSGGWKHSCGLRRNGTLVCWGRNVYNGVAVPRDGAFAAVSASLYHNCGVRTDGILACWGANYWPGENTVQIGQAVPPGGAFTAVSAGTLHTCAVRTDGTLACWGAGHADDTGEFGFGQSVPPGGAFTAVSAGSIHTCGVRTDGTVACWGAMATVPDGTFTTVSAGDSYACGVRTDGTVACWGAMTMAPDGTFTAVSAGWEHACGLRTDGTLACWGAIATPPGGTFTAVDAGWEHACGLRADGTVACWGDNQYGQAVPPDGT